MRRKLSCSAYLARCGKTARLRATRVWLLQRVPKHWTHDQLLLLRVLWGVPLCSSVDKSAACLSVALIRVMLTWLPSALPVPVVDDGLTVAILAQGTHWALDAKQAFGAQRMPPRRRRQALVLRCERSPGDARDALHTVAWWCLIPQLQRLFDWFRGVRVGEASHPGPGGAAATARKRQEQFPQLPQQGLGELLERLIRPILEQLRFTH